MSKKPLLSICVPTFNGGQYIEELLASIFIQKQKGTEVIIIDDSSTDNTFDKMAKFKEKHPEYNLKVYKNKKNKGFDKNVLRAVTLAKGEYCWLLGQDDLLLSGSLKKVLGLIKKSKRATLIHANYERYDNILNKITAEAMVSIKKDKVFTDAENFLFTPTDNSYFKYLGTNVITMSTNVFSRNLWLKVSPLLKKYLGHNFIHCFIIAKMIKENPKIVYLGTPQVRYRSNNARIWSNDIWKDYNMIFIDYLIQIGYDEERANKVRRHQRVFEKREAAIKHSLLKHVYKYARPLIGLFRILRSKVVNQ